MTRSVLRLTHFLGLAAFILSCGGNWWVLQGVAWAKMIGDYAQAVPLAQAVSMTLSGQHPCPICKAIAAKKKSERTQAWVLDKYDKKTCPDAVTVATAPAGVGILYPVTSISFLPRTDSPPVPPPRLS